MTVGTRDLINAAEAAARLGVSVRKVQRWAKAGVIRAQKLGKGRTTAYVFDPADVERLRAELEAGGDK